jgi:predicted nuclease of predicted toxin-antitoxin system
VILWPDAHISPKLCPWIRREFGMDAVAVRDLGLRGAEDPEIFAKARAAGAVVLSKDEDFIVLLERLGPPPKVIWLTCGNVPNARLKRILTDALPDAIATLERGEALVEISKTEGPVRKRVRLRRSTRRRKAR